MTEADRRVWAPALLLKSVEGTLRAIDGLGEDIGVLKPLNDNSEGKTSEFGREETVEEKTELE